MNESRPILETVTPQWVVEGAGVKLRRSFPTRRLDYPDPFLLFDHFGSDNPADYLAGFPMHPHRGIETVTYMLDGLVQHQDSIGNSGVIGAGDAQWMTAGRGILHEEMPQPREGKMAGFQLWVNLPAKDKMTQPRYQEIKSAQIPLIARNDGVTIRVIAGRVDDARGPVSEIIADPTYLDVAIPANAAFTHAIARDHAALAYVFDGAGMFGVNQATVRAATLIVFGDGDEIRVNTAQDPVRFLLFSGKPSYEPIVRYGPFVMNTREGIEQTLRDLQAGTFV